MQIKKGIRYLRFSHDKQSYHSIERQDMLTSYWLSNNQVTCVDTFKDEGHTARTFDRPDIKQLFAFIRKNYRQIDYLIVSELTRFSREAGDAINMVKKIQAEYGVRIVSASRGAIYDCMDSNSFFMMGLEFLLGNSENIKRQNDINSGIYAAKAIKGLWIKGGRSPYGYQKEGEGKNRRLVLHPVESVIVKLLFTEFLANTPLKEIYRKAVSMGFNRTGNSAIQDILSNSLYYGYQYVKPYKEQPGGMYAIADIVPLIDVISWKAVQDKLKRPEKPRISIATDFPLRGLLRCYCGNHLTGAPSRNRVGKYYNYYKCKTSGHINVNAEKIQLQLKEALKCMSLPDRTIAGIKKEAGAILKERLSENTNVLRVKEHELSDLQQKIDSLELKWINNQLGG